MTKKEMFEAMQEIEFVLFMLESKSSLHDGEIGAAHSKSREVLETLYNETKEVK